MALGTAGVTVTFELPAPSTASAENLGDSGIFQVYPNPASDYITVSGEFEQLTLLNTGGVTLAKVTTCGYENKALRAITPQENVERIFFEAIKFNLMMKTIFKDKIKKGLDKIVHQISDSLNWG
ncbi:MAG: hypothetical protein LBK58_04825 [Prevotellaceae bacterium]|jgi:hypothetical protein|nr:hypothetical protein [Prevotellaceae bacterium]